MSLETEPLDRSYSTYY